MADDFATRVAGIGALAEPARRALYAFVVAADGPVSREQAADGVGVAVHTAKFHLDRLVGEGLLEVEYRRLSGRRGPGAGRPAKLYRRSAGEVAVSLPERRYDLVGTILAAGVDRALAGEDVADAVRAEARQRGVAAGSTGAGGDPGADLGADLGAVSAVLAGAGFEPRRRDDALELANCPFDALAREHTALVCGLNAAFVDGVIAGVGSSGLRACLEPEDGLCCVRVRPVDPPA